MLIVSTPNIPRKDDEVAMCKANLERYESEVCEWLEKAKNAEERATYNRKLIKIEKTKLASLEKLKHFSSPEDSETSETKVMIHTTSADTETEEEGVYKTPSNINDESVTGELNSTEKPCDVPAKPVVQTEHHDPFSHTHKTGQAVKLSISTMLTHDIRQILGNSPSNIALKTAFDKSQHLEDDSSMVKFIAATGVPNEHVVEFLGILRSVNLEGKKVAVEVNPLIQKVINGDEPIDVLDSFGAFLQALCRAIGKCCD